jgi:ParB-like chromosome segregation protein Spo0J
VFLEPKLIIFKSLIQSVEIDKIKPRQFNLNKDLIDTLKQDIKEKGLLCPLVVHENKQLLDGHHRYEAIKDFCTYTQAYVVKDSDMEKLLSKLNSYLWFDSLGTLND